MEKAPPLRIQGALESSSIDAETSLLQTSDTDELSSLLLDSPVGKQAEYKSFRGAPLDGTSFQLTNWSVTVVRAPTHDGGMKCFVIFSGRLVSKNKRTCHGAYCDYLRLSLDLQIPDGGTLFNWKMGKEPFHCRANKKLSYKTDFDPDFFDLISKTTIYSARFGYYDC